MISLAALLCFGALLIADSIAVIARGQATSEKMAIDAACAGVYAASISARAFHDCGPAARRELVDAAAAMEQAAASDLAVRRGPLGFPDRDASHSLSHEPSNLTKVATALAPAPNSDSARAASWISGRSQTPIYLPA